MTLLVQDYLEINGSPNTEIVRVSSDSNGDTFTSKKFHKIKNVQITNHGATFNTGTKDPPQVGVTQGSATTNAKVSIIHTTTFEVFSLMIEGEF